MALRTADFVCNFLKFLETGLTKSMKTAKNFGYCVCFLANWTAGIRPIGIFHLAVGRVGGSGCRGNRIALRRSWWWHDDLFQIAPKSKEEKNSLISSYIYFLSCIYSLLIFILIVIESKYNHSFFHKEWCFHLIWSKLCSIDWQMVWNDCTLINPKIELIHSQLNYSSSKTFPPLFCLQ